MTPEIIEPIDLRARGFDALVQSLGWVNAVRFIQQYERSRLNYAQERNQILPNWDADEMIRQLGNVQPK